jgi:hypothetical protein
MVENVESVPNDPSDGAPEKQHRSGRRRIRYRIKKKKPFPQRAKRSIRKFFEKRKNWLLVFLAAIALIGILLWGFLEVEKTAIYQSSHQVEGE